MKPERESMMKNTEALKKYPDLTGADLTGANLINANLAPQWMGTEPCYAAETNAHISAFFARNTMRLIESVAAKSGIDLQTEMRKSEAVERNLTELRRFALLTPCQKVAEFERYDQ